MQGECSREMSLKEWVERLPEIHRARKEYAELVAISKLPSFEKIWEWEGATIRSAWADYEEVCRGFYNQVLAYIDLHTT